MTIFQNLWSRLHGGSQPTLDPIPGIQCIQDDPVHLKTPSEFEHALDEWTRQWGPGNRDQADEQLAAMNRRAETELQRYFGDDALRLVQSAAGKPGNGPLLLAADRLFINFLGRRAAMAVTRKLYSARP
jgi:hypothetical protein